MRDLIDPVLLRSLVAVAETKSFTLAAQQLGVSQSTVSQHISRLEQRTDRRLLSRDTHSVALTPDGDAVLPFARQALEANARIEGVLTGSILRGHVRFGASEDFVFSALPDVLAEFTKKHNAVDLELTVGLSGILYERYDAGDLDLIFVKRRRGDERGRSAWREDLAWIGRPGLHLAADAPLPLILFPPPSITRARALEALEIAKQSWRVVCTSDSLSGIRAAALAGLGVAAHSTRLIPQGLGPLAASRHLPPLGQIEFVVVGGGAGNDAANALAAAILSNAGRIRIAAS
ncbi:LysR family transcriptional regulator [Methylocella tundrae]|jgi:DNA-binding transcriptional LysR family regulator|uniref:LysR family transcriptional regulator n=1 Tax=Methylocella tundrae TaxID=227605 RepID=A0A4U8Z1F5_METTU|nr:LysR family transcriptional regulator [Methylocella tundrae]WPP03142.1 LysR family transcriptional regulator [Methylocella tundrae]VFU09121.1 LysR family transcriptional regulator [Methylocella tundrae]